jgi:hypothetical protein
MMKFMFRLRPKLGKCQQHLDQCLEAAKDRADDEAERDILAIIRQEKDCSFWQRLNFALGKYWVRCTHCSDYEARGASGNYEARGASGDYEARGASGGKYKARMVIFCILAAVKRFSWISWKEESR